MLDNMNSREFELYKNGKPDEDNINCRNGYYRKNDWGYRYNFKRL